MPVMAGLPAPAGPEPAARRTGLASSVTATVLAVLALILMAAALVLSALVHQLSVLGSGPIIPVVVVYAARTPLCTTGSATTASRWPRWPSCCSQCGHPRCCCSQW